MINDHVLVWKKKSLVPGQNTWVDMPHWSKLMVNNTYIWPSLPQDINERLVSICQIVLHNAMRHTFISHDEVVVVLYGSIGVLANKKFKFVRLFKFSSLNSSIREHMCNNLLEWSVLRKSRVFCRLCGRVLVSFCQIGAQRTSNTHFVCAASSRSKFRKEVPGGIVGQKQDLVRE